MKKDSRKVVVAMSPKRSLQDATGQAGGVKKSKVIVAMSGGVDSSVAAKLLADQGHDALGIFLHFWKPPKELSSGYPELSSEAFENKCCSAKAFMDARRVCQKIGIKLYTLNFSKEFKKDIVDNFLNEYKIGNTPNPCVRCNKLVKLGLLIKRAKKLGYDHVASGHYARLKKVKDKYKLYRAKDKEKDQSYFLWTLTQEQLKHLIFPLGDYKKPQVRKLASKYGMTVAEKKESQEVCFVPEKSHNDFLKRYLKLKKGPIVALTPRPTSPASELAGGRADPSPSQERGVKDMVIGEHQGLPLYTIGQRRGVEIGGTGPYYVARLDYKKNILYVVNDFDDPELYSDSLVAKNVNWISGDEPTCLRRQELPLKCDAVIRYRHTPVKCEVTPHPSPLLSKERGQYRRYMVKFKEPQRAITPGQSIVFYRGDEVLGGGIIM